MNAFWIILISFVILTCFNVYYLFYLKSNINAGKKVSENDNYFKLDAKIDLLKYVALAILSVGSFFGITKYSEILRDFEKIENQKYMYEELEKKYDELNNDYSKLAEEYNKLDQIHTNLQLEIKDFEKDFVEVNYKIKEATRIIPEANVRILTKQLIEQNLRFVGINPIIDSHSDTEEMKKAIEEARNMLKTAGYSQSEIDAFINEQIEKNRHLKMNKDKLN